MPLYIFGVLVKWLSRKPVTLVSGVQFPYTPPQIIKLDVEKRKRVGEGMNYIKTIFKALFGYYAKTHEKQINKAQKWIDSAQETFASAVEEAIISEKQFDEIIKDANEKIAELQAILNDAESKKAEAIQFKNNIQKLLK